MKDIQNLRDHRRISIRKVGVKTISYPVTVLDRAKRVQYTVATVNMYVNLPHHFKGTHMSRFVEILNRFHGNFNLRAFHSILEEMKTRLEAEAAHLEIEFPYFLQKSDSRGEIGQDRYLCRLHGSLQEDDDLVLEIDVPVYQPCSVIETGELPRSPGHWGQARVEVRFRHFIWIEELIALVESALIGGERDIDSVESVCRRVGQVLAEHESISWFKVVVENFAHGYTTFATISNARFDHTVQTGAEARVLQTQ
jgi:GTP cyclohydrolase I